VATGGRLVIAEDHYPQGGLGAAMLEALAGTGLPLRPRRRAVSGLPGSGTPDELTESRRHLRPPDRRRPRTDQGLRKRGNQ
jgi:transketolase C-terminal domain/subunit